MTLQLLFWCQELESNQDFGQLCSRVRRRWPHPSAISAVSGRFHWPVSGQGRPVTDRWCLICSPRAESVILLNTTFPVVMIPVMTPTWSRCRQDTIPIPLLSSRWILGLLSSMLLCSMLSEGKLKGYMLGCGGSGTCWDHSRAPVWSAPWLSASVDDRL